MIFRFDIIGEYAPYFLMGTALTIGLSLAGVAIGTVLGMGIAIGKMCRAKIISIPFKCYVNFVRGTPLLVQILVVHFGIIPLFLGKSNGIASGIVALSLNSAAYIAETFRGGIQSIDLGQMEASRSLGMSNWQAMRYIILPQAIKLSLPPLGNEFVSLIKDSSLVSVIACPEIIYWAQAMNAQYYRVWEPYLTAAFIYLFLTFSMSTILGRFERKMKTA